MAAINMTPETMPKFVERIKQLKPDSDRQWGELTPINMIGHLHRSLEVALSEIPVKDESNFFGRNILRPIVFSGVLPWPKGKIKTLPVFLVEPDGEFEKEKERLIEKLETFTEAAEREPNKKMFHPFFGEQTMKFCTRQVGMHFDHHLNQFGV